MSILRILQAVPQATRLFDVAQRAANGDQEAVEYIKHSGWTEALDLVQPGSGEASRRALEAARDAARVLRGDVIDAEYRVLGNYPWSPFVNWIKKRRWGTFVILGPKGQGKTTLAMRLAEVWHQETGWDVEAVNVYPEDRYPFVQTVSTARFTKVIKSIMDILNPPEKKVESDDDEPQPQRELTPEEIDRALEPYRRRIIVIDEMSLTVGTSGADAGRIMVRQIMAQARHLSWLIIYVGQLVKMLPNDLLNSEAVMVKRPAGRERIIDRDDSLTYDLWDRAEDAFRDLRQSPYWQDMADTRAWAFVDCQSIGEGHGWSGMMPFCLPGQQEAEIIEGEIVQEVYEDGA